MEFNTSDSEGDSDYMSLTQSVASTLDDYPDPVNFRGRDLQVIVKVADIELEPGASHEGVWHVEGMSHENIAATAPARRRMNS